MIQKVKKGKQKVIFSVIEILRKNGQIASLKVNINNNDSSSLKNAYSPWTLAENIYFCWVQLKKKISNYFSTFAKMAAASVTSLKFLSRLESV